FSDNGRLDIRAWEGGPIPPGVAAVRQNLTLLIDNGQITDAVTHADSGAFGKTLGDTTYVWRSGVGIRADGSIVTVHGNALSVQTLAQLLLDAGAIRAMQLDINRDWTSYIYYRHTPSFAAVKLTADQVRPADRYLQTSTRDFVAVEAR
ncbi:MAG TPA: phosphodiester glycosidase family protein, partial [Propionicimonas sp.]